MAKVHPEEIECSFASCHFTSKQETFTVWMKSLVLNGNGCTVFDSNGQIVYCVDNYDIENSDEVYLMDRKGKTMFMILRKQSRLFKFWEGHRFTEKPKKQKLPSFRVRKASKSSGRSSSYEVIIGLDKNKQDCHKMESSTSKSTCRISDQFGALVAELKRKKSDSGVYLGDDVLTMVVEPNIDLSLIMGLFVAFSLINSKMYAFWKQ